MVLKELENYLNLVEESQFSYMENKKQKMHNSCCCIILNHFYFCLTLKGLFSLFRGHLFSIVVVYTYLNFHAAF